MARPLVASGTGGLSEQIVDGDTGVLVRVGDVHVLAAGLERILHDRALAERLGAAGRRRAHAEFTDDRHVDRLLCLYDEVCRTPLAAGAAR